MAAVQIIPVSGRRQQKQFLQLPWQLYRDAPHWVPPLRTHQKELVGFKHHPFYDDRLLNLVIGAGQHYRMLLNVFQLSLWFLLIVRENAPKGLAIVGDGGVHEYIEDKQGNIIQTPKTDTLVSFRGGEKVHKDFDSLMDAKGIDSDIYKATVLTSLQVENRLSNLRVEKVLDNHLKDLDKKMERGIKNGFKNVNMHNHTNIDLDHKFFRQDTL